MAAKHAVPPHQHDWQDNPNPKGGWSYICSVCKAKSRNPFVQPKGYEKPVVVTSLYIGPDGNGSVFQWRATPSGSEKAPPDQAHVQQRRLL